jgi:hypothetical protein
MMQLEWMQMRKRLSQLLARSEEGNCLASEKLDKGEPGSKLKKRTRVLVEVMANDIMAFLDFL